MNKISEKIISDARALANSTMEEGALKAQETIERAHNDIAIYREKNMHETFELRDEIVRRRISVANLEAKKNMLKARRDVLDSVYDGAIEAVCGDDKTYLTLISKMLGYAEDGEEVCISARDKDRITEGFIKSESARLGITLTLSSEYADIRGGIILRGKNYDKNLSVDTEMASLRDETEPQIAISLFGDK